MFTMKINYSNSNSKPLTLFGPTRKNILPHPLVARSLNSQLFLFSCRQYVQHCHVKPTRNLFNIKKLF